MVATAGFGAFCNRGSGLPRRSAGGGAAGGSGEPFADYTRGPAASSTGRAAAGGARRWDLVLRHRVGAWIGAASLTLLMLARWY
jgi:hypothetical protein